MTWFTCKTGTIQALPLCMYASNSPAHHSQFHSYELRQKHVDNIVQLNRLELLYLNLTVTLHHMFDMEESRSLEHYLSSKIL